MKIVKKPGNDVIILNGVAWDRYNLTVSGKSHFTQEEAIELALKIGAKRTYFTHFSHDLGLHAEVQKKLPEIIFLAWDGLILEV